MTSQRIKGIETQLIITRDGNLESELVDIQKFEMTVQTEIISKGYLGEKTERKDEGFKGIKFSMELHLHSQDWFQFVQSVLERAKRNTPDTVFSIATVLNFPNGQTPRATLPDVHFGPLPTTIPSRDDYVNAKIEGECEDWDLQF